MGKPVTLKLIRLVYQLEGQEPAEVVARSASLAAWDRTRGARKWPTAQEGPFQWMAFLAWHALTRTGRFEGTFDEFLDQADAVEMLEDEDESEDSELVVGPTHQAEPAT